MKNLSMHYYWYVSGFDRNYLIKVISIIFEEVDIFGNIIMTENEDVVKVEFEDLRNHLAFESKASKGLILFT